MNIRIFFFSLFVLSLVACGSKKSEPTTENGNLQTEAEPVPLPFDFTQGTFCANIHYANSKTGTESDYTLLVGTSNKQLVSIYWPQGGHSDAEEFNPQPLSVDGKVMLHTKKANVSYAIELIGDSLYCDNNVFGHLQQCKGRTKSGDRCKRLTDNDSGYCFQHEK